jgi:sugar/nucleoside kinase (ribokinase family)
VRPPAVTVIGCVQADVVMSPVTDLPTPGGTLLAEQTTVRVGGAGANAALASVEAGMDVRLIGCIGEDHLGDWMRAQLAPAGLADELVVVPGEASGLTVALESPARDRSFLTYLGVNARWEPAMIPDDALTCENLLLCDYFVAPPLRGDAARRLLDTARARGARTFFDTTWDPEGFSSESRAEVLGLLPSVDVFLPNEVEVCAIAGSVGSAGSAASAGSAGSARVAGSALVAGSVGATGGAGDALPAARELQTVSGGWVVVKLGPRGCFAAGPNGTEITVPAPAMTVADTTGAGDAFNAGLVGALARGAGWEEALTEATRFATTIISRPSNERYRVALTEVKG